MKRLDLNLLFTLQALLKTKSTTAAAKELNTSQSAVSRSLVKIREIVGDQVFVRRGQRFEFTERGKELEKEVPLLFEAIEQVLSNRDFEPSDCSETLSISINASIAHWLVPPLFKFLSSEAPNINLAVEDWGITTPGMIDDKKIVMGINYFPIDLPKSCLQKKVGKDDFVLVCRAGHSLSQFNSLAVRDIKNEKFAVHTMTDWNDAEPKAMEQFRKNDAYMDVLLRCSHMGVILKTVEESDMVFLCPAMTGRQLGSEFAVIPIVDDIDEDLGSIGLFYSNKLVSDPMTKWLVESMMKVIKKVQSQNT
ncbi:LysR family transcriptional regulator [Vibrio sp. FNV 38]|nr:LysR family transcriptional regulator [Vibrio sp. FNV 38]